MSGQNAPPIATASLTVGPFFSFGLTTNAELGQLATSEIPGEPINLTLRVFDGDGAPVPDAMVEIWHASEDGRFLFGRLGTDAAGVCRFSTVKPVVLAPSVDAPHINICLFMRGLLRHVYTRAYVSDDSTLKGDPVLTLVPEERRETLVAQPVRESPGSFTFDIRLQGERETVFFDL